MSENEKRLENLDEDNIGIAWKKTYCQNTGSNDGTAREPMDALVYLKDSSTHIKTETEYRAIPTCSVSGAWTWAVWWKKDGLCGFGWEEMYKAEHDTLEGCKGEVMDDLKSDGTVKDPELSDFED